MYNKPDAVREKQPEGLSIPSEEAEAYNPHQGFIGRYPVDVANYLFRSGGDIKKPQGYPHSRQIADSLMSVSKKEHYLRSQKLTRFLRARDLTFSRTNKNGSYRIFTVPCTTTIVPLAKSTFDQLERAAQALVISLRRVLQSLYGSGSLQDSGFVQSLPPEVRAVFIEAIESSAHYLPQLHHPSMADYPFFDNVGLDLVLVGEYLKVQRLLPRWIKDRKEKSIPELPFKILEINAGAPSGASNNFNILQGLSHVSPELMDSAERVLPNDHFDVLYNTFKSLGDSWTGLKEGIAIVLPPGGANGATPEIHQLAAYSGLIYAEANQLYTAKDGTLRLRTITGKDPIVTSIYSRINMDSALFDPEKGIFLRDADTGETLTLTDPWKPLKSGKLQPVLDERGKAIPLHSDYAIPNALKLIHEKRLYLGGLNRILDNKIILATLTSYGPLFCRKELLSLGLDPELEQLMPPETLPPRSDSVDVIRKNPHDWVVKSPNLSGGTGVHILMTMSEEAQKEVIDEITEEPQRFAYQRLVKIARIPVAKKDALTKGYRFANLAADLRMWMFFGAGEKHPVPKLTHNALVRFASQEVGPLSSIVNTSKGGGYAPMVVIDDVNHPSSVRIPELADETPAVPQSTDLPFFVAAQIVQISRLLTDLSRRLEQPGITANHLYGSALALKLQTREIVSFLHPRNMEPLQRFAERLEKKIDRDEIARFHIRARKTKLRFLEATREIENELSPEAISLVDRLRILDLDDNLHGYRPEDRALDQKTVENIRGTLAKGRLKKGLYRWMDSLNRLVRLTPFTEQVLPLKTKILLREDLKSFQDLARIRLLRNPNDREFHQYFETGAKLPELEFDAVQGHRCGLKADQILVASDFERTTQSLLTDSDWISPATQNIRKAWAQRSDWWRKRGRPIPETEFRVHQKNHPEIETIQAALDGKIKTRNLVQAFQTIEKAFPYATYNLQQYSLQKGVPVGSLLLEGALIPDRINVLDLEDRKRRKLPGHLYAGECFAKKREQHGLFSESDTYLWVAEEASSATQLVTIGHELVHYHQIQRMMELEKEAIQQGPKAFAEFLNFYGNFLGLAVWSYDSLTDEVAETRKPLFGLMDLWLAEPRCKTVRDLRRALAKSDDRYHEVLAEVGRLYGWVTPSSIPAKVKALREVLPAIENAKNWRFAESLGLRTNIDWVQTILPTANEKQKEIAREYLTRQVDRASFDPEFLRFVGNHQLYGVFFARPKKGESFTLHPEAGFMNLGGSYRSMQQQQ